jgi:hypothetical protein
MNPSGRREPDTWQGEPEERASASGLRQESRSFEELLAQIQYGPEKRMQRGGFSTLGVPVLFLLLGLGTGGVGGWLWARGGMQIPLQEENLLMPTDPSIGYEAVLAGEKEGILLSGGQVPLPMEPRDESSLSQGSPPRASVSEQPASPAPRERERTPSPSNDMNRAYLGVRGRTFERAGVQGVQILEVFPDSPAAMAGLRSHRDTVQNQGQPSTVLPGHLIVGANGQAIRSEEDLARIIAHSAPGDVMQVIVTAADGSSREDFLIVLDEAPSASSPVKPGRQ